MLLPMRKSLLALFFLLGGFSAQAWWDPGHMVTAMIAYLNLDPPVRAKVDALVATLQRDYPQVNHFIALGPWPDDLKADGVRAYDTWHYCDIPHNPDGVALPPAPEVDIRWAIRQCRSILQDERPKQAEKARFLAFLVHFVSDLHQPLHSTSVYSNELPGGNRGGNEFPLEGTWRNLHMLWDDGCGFLSDYNDIRPYGEPPQPLRPDQVARIQALASRLMERYPENTLPEAHILDADFWALESHKLALDFGYRGIKDPQARGRARYLQPGDEPTPHYLERGQEVVQRQLALSGYRLAALLNELLKEE